jgi:hypothetical protein
MVRNYYGAPDSSSYKGVEEYSLKTQIVNYDVYRASIESINRQLWSSASGILLWKSNSSWPSATWQVYDWYLQAHAGYYGTKKAGETIHVQLNRDNLSVSFVNMSAIPLANISINATLINTKMETTWSERAIVKVGSDAVTETGITVPETSEMQFLKLVASDSEGKVLSENLYWISKENNYKALNTLPEPTIEASAKKMFDSNTNEYTVTLKNTGKTIAFMVSLKVCGKESYQEILPSYWSDNYFSLLPGENREIQLHFNPGNEDFQLWMESWKGKALKIDLKN